MASSEFSPYTNESLRVGTNAFTTPYLQFQGCKKVGDVYVYPETRKDTAINFSKLSKNYSSSIEEVLTKPGYHTWLIFEDGSFHSAKILTPYETLSKHGNLYREYGGKKVVAAGECLIGNDKEVTYNLLSGTFMQTIGEMYTKKYKSGYESVYEPWMTNEWKTHGAKSVEFRNDKQKTLVFNVELTESALRELYDAGISIRKFKSEKDCDSYTQKFLIDAKKKAARNQYDYLVQKGYIKKTNGIVKSFEEWLVENPGFKKSFNTVVPEGEMYFTSGGKRKSTRKNIRKRVKSRKMRKYK